MIDHHLTDAEITQLEAELRQQERLFLRSYKEHDRLDFPHLYTKGLIASVCGSIALVIALTGFILWVWL